jgi:hypothetical protein
MSMNPPQYVRSVTEAFVEYARRLEELVGAAGWDQPSSLWRVQICDPSDDMYSILDTLDTSDGAFALPVVFSVELVAELLGHPADALVGVYAPEDSTAVALVTEGWVHHPDRVLAAGGDLEALGQPSEYDDSLETRIVQLVARDGTEVFYQRNREGEEFHHVGSFGGRVPRAVRRTLRLPSLDSASIRNLPSCAAIRNRVSLVLATEAAIEGLANLELHTALELLRVHRDDLYIACCLSFGLFEENWADARLAAVRTVHKTLGLSDDSKNSGGLLETSLETLEWMDGWMWAERVADRFPPRVEVVRLLEELVLEGKLERSDVSRILEIADSPPRDFDEPY